MGEKLDQSAIDELLKGVNSPKVVPEDRPATGSLQASLGQNEMDALFSSGVSSTAESVSGPVSSLGQNEMDALFQKPKLSAPVSRGNLTQEEVDAMMQKDVDGPKATAMDQPVTGSPQGSMDQNELDALFSSGVSSTAESVPEPVSSLGQDEMDALFQKPKLSAPVSRGNLTQEEVDAMMRPASKPDQSMSQKFSSPVTRGHLTQEEVDAMMQPASKPDRVMNQSEIDQLLGAADIAKIEQSSLKQSELDKLFNKESAKPSQSSSAVLDQAEIDKMMAAAKASPVSLMDQSEMDALFAGAAPSSQVLDQGDMDALLAGPAPASNKDKAKTPNPSQDGASSASGEMSQSEIDAMFGSKPKKHDISSGSADKHHSESTDLNQDEINFLLSTSKDPVHQTPPQRNPIEEQVPNCLEAPTISRKSVKKVIKAGRNQGRTRLFGGVYYLPDRVEKRELAVNALQKLFERAEEFQFERPSHEEGSEICVMTNKRGLKVKVLLTGDAARPVNLKFESIIFKQGNANRQKIQQIVQVDRFTKNAGVTANRWVNWFDQQFDADSLEHLMKCA